MAANVIEPDTLAKILQLAKGVARITHRGAHLYWGEYPYCVFAEWHRL
jgi:hypothetical protein